MPKQTATKTAPRPAVKPRTPVRKSIKATVKSAAVAQTAPPAGVPRRVVVLGSLVGMVTLTCGVLLVLAPAPLAPAAGLFAEGPSDPLDPVYDAVDGGVNGGVNGGEGLRPWQHIYVRQSGAKGTTGAGDHFLIGDGRDGPDGEIRITDRWQRQRPALPPPGASGIDPSCVSICLAGDLDRRPPTDAQVRSLTQLVRSLDRRLNLPADRVVMLTDAAGRPAVGPAGVGRQFPVSAFTAAVAR